MILIAASCPSNSDAAVTKRSGDWRPDEPGKLFAAVLIKLLISGENTAEISAGLAEILYKSTAFAIEKILI
jgi:hypothetical protein